MADETTTPEEWRGDFEAAEERRREAALLTTPSERLAWLEEALAFAIKVGAMSKKQ